jgi:probable rRNA maturation factor
VPAVTPESPNFCLPSARTLARFLAAAQKAIRLNGQVTVLLTTDAAIRKLNRQFRGKNKSTDVLSFPAAGPGAEDIAGDLAISVTTAFRQAAEQGHSLSTEIKVLILHGLLHLAGYDHEADSGRMARRERLLRAKLNLPQGLIERTAEANTKVLKGRGFSRIAEPTVLKGHGFRRAGRGQKRIAALAAEGMRDEKRALPQGLKPDIHSAVSSARLKPRPFKANETAIPSGSTAVSRAPNRAAKANRP